MTKYHLTERQAQAILDLRLHKLTGLEQDKIISEYREILDKIEDLYGIYDCSSEKMVYGNYVTMNDEQISNKSGSLPVWDNQNYYFGVQFPNKVSIITNRMGVWIFSSSVILVVIIFFSYGLFVILKQKRLSEIQKDFINNMTHEFKTPISTISISSEVLKDPNIIRQPERLLNYATIIQNESHRLKNQVERVLTIASLDMEEIGLKREELDIHKVIKESLAVVKLSLEENKGRVETDLSARHSLVYGDKMHLTNVIYNLLDNAIKYCDREPIVTIKTHNINGKMEIIISDNGIGVDKDQQKKVFDKFYRVPTGDVHDVKGFGLGLNYVQLIVNEHGGSVDLHSEIGKGSSFNIKLKNV